MIRCAERGVYIRPSERLQVNDSRHGMQQARQLLDGMVVYIPGETSGEIEGLVLLLCIILYMPIIIESRDYLRWRSSLHSGI